MAQDSKIEWTDSTWNPVTGCTKVSQGCKFCYAKTLHDQRYKAHLEGKAVPPTYHVPFETVTLHPERLRLPISWQKPRRIFVNSMSDLFHPDVPFEFIDQVFGVMALSPHHTFQVLTKRPERMREYLTDPKTPFRVADIMAGYRPEKNPFVLSIGKHSAELLRDSVRVEGGWPSEYAWPLKGVWLGTSVENQETADSRIPELVKCPAAVRFLSCEPLLGPVSLRGTGFEIRMGNLRGPITTNIHWVIVGGESGKGARPMHPDWARSLREECQAAGVAFFFKQHGEYRETEGFDHIFHKSAEQYTVGPKGDRQTLRMAVLHPERYDAPAGYARITRVGKKAAGRTLDGRTWDEFPEVTPCA